MKKFIAVILMIAVSLSLSSCGKKKEGDLGKQTTIDAKNGYTLVEEVLPFKFNKDEKELKQDPNAKMSGFVTNESNAAGKISTKSQAVEIAKKEINEKFNKVNIAYDRTQGIWKIKFSVDTVTEEKTTNTPVMTVYVDEDGYTLATTK